MSSPFRTELGQLEATTSKTRAAVDVMSAHARELKSAVDELGRWNGAAKKAFLEGMGINLPELERLNSRLASMAENLNMTGQGVVANEADASKNLATAAQTHSALSGPSLNR